MATIPTMTGDPTTAPAGTADSPPAAPPSTTIAAAPAARPHARTLAVPIPTAIVAALVAGMFGMLFFSLNGLRSDIDTLRTDTNQRFAEMNQRFAEVHAILLDHTDRLARIETHLEIKSAADAAAPDHSSPAQ